MEEKSKNYAMVILSSALLLSLGFNAMPEATHYCEAREIKAYCFDLSATEKTCYTLSEKQGGKRCSSLWKPIKESAEFVEVYANNKLWECEVRDKTINSYTKCYSGKYEAYLGELL